MSMNVGGSKGGPKADINVTPMIDVLLVLLIIFMVITPITPFGLQALAPQPPKPNTPPPDINDPTVVIIINKAGMISLNEEPVTKENLGARLEQIFKTRAERVVFVKGDPDLDFASVAAAIDIAKGAGMDKVGLMTPKIEAGQ